MPGIPKGTREENAGEWTAVFLDALRELPNVLKAAKAAGVSRAMAYKERETDPVFRDQWDLAWRESRAKMADEIERVALELATNRSHLHNRLRIEMLRSLRPETYRETTNQNHAHDGGLQITVKYEDASNDAGNDNSTASTNTL